MLSKITIELDFELRYPYIRIIHNHTSDDVRDKLIQFFFERLSNTSQWAKVVWLDPPSSNERLVMLCPIPSDNMEREIEQMKTAIKKRDEIEEMIKESK